MPRYGFGTGCFPFFSPKAFLNISNYIFTCTESNVKHELLTLFHIAEVTLHRPQIYTVLGWALIITFNQNLLDLVNTLQAVVGIDLFLHSCCYILLHWRRWHCDSYSSISSGQKNPSALLKYSSLFIYLNIDVLFTEGELYWINYSRSYDQINIMYFFKKKEIIFDDCLFF